MNGDDIRTLNILGRKYSIRASAGEEGDTLQEAADLLHKRLEESRRKFPKASNDELLVLTALNLCVPLIQQGRQLREVEQRLAASIELISRQLHA